MLGERLQLKFFDPGKAKTVTQIKKGIGDSLVFTTRDFNNHDMDKVAEFLHAGEKLKHDRTTPLVSVTSTRTTRAACAPSWTSISAAWLSPTTCSSSA